MPGGSSPLAKHEANHFASPSTQSLFQRPETNSDVTFNRAPRPSVPRIKTAQTVKSQPDMPTGSMPSKPAIQRPFTGIETSRHRSNSNNLAQPRKSQADIASIIASKKPTHQRPASRQQMSRERLEYLAQPKTYRFQAAGVNVARAQTAQHTTQPTDVPAEFSRLPPANASRLPSALPDKVKRTVGDERFQQLMEVFSEVHESTASGAQTMKSVIANNASLQDEKGNWQSRRPTVANSKPTFRNRRQTLADKLNSKLDVFLIDVGA